MKGLILWASTNCRSTLALYREIIKQLSVPVRLAFYVYKDGGMRVQTGFRSDEFSDISSVVVGDDFNRGCQLMDECSGFNHIFTIFQRAPTYKKLIIEALRRGEHVGIAAEAPCNMSSRFRWLMKELYNRFYLPFYASSIVNKCDFFISYSGKKNESARLIGWDLKKIKPFGYFPPAIEGSRCRVRTHNSPFTILCTGELSRYRGADVLVNALIKLKRRGVEYTAIITQKGEMLGDLQKLVKKYNLPVRFAGFLDMPDLVREYENCSVYVGAGRSEPWGMRLNDALNCGAPLVVSDGMGGVKLVEDYGCGLSFKAGDPDSLCDALERLAVDKKLYMECAQRAEASKDYIKPSERAKEFLELMRTAGEAWF